MWLELLASSGVASGQRRIPLQATVSQLFPTGAALNHRRRVTRGVTSWQGAGGRRPQGATLKGIPAPQLPADLRVLCSQTASTPPSASFLHGPLSGNPV